MMKKISALLFFLLYFLSASFSQAPDFTMVSSQGETFNLHDELDAGKTVILDFFGVTCGSCQFSVPILEDVWNNDFNNGELGWVWAIEISYKDDEAINEFLAEYGGTYPGFSIIDDDSVYNEPYGYDAPYTPQYYMICPDGDARNFPLENIDRFLENCGVGLENNEVENLFTLFVNGRQFNLDGGDNRGNYTQIQLVNLQGGVVYAHKVLGNNAHDIQHEMRSGMYIVLLFSDNGDVCAEKIVIP